jgi:hypothetical protein
MTSRRCAAALTGGGDIQAPRMVAELYSLEFAKVVDVTLVGRPCELPSSFLCPKVFDLDRPERRDRFNVDSSVRPEGFQSEAHVGLPWHQVRSDIPLAYCSFGSRVPKQHRAKHLLASIIRAFCTEYDIQVLAKLHSNADVQFFKDVPARDYCDKVDAVDDCFFAGQRPTSHMEVSCRFGEH